MIMLRMLCSKSGRGVNLVEARQLQTLCSTGSRSSWRASARVYVPLLIRGGAASCKNQARPSGGTWAP